MSAVEPLEPSGHERIGGSTVRLHDRPGADAELDPVRRHGAVDTHRAAVLAEPDQVEREAHGERVDRAAARQVQRVVRRHRVELREPLHALRAPLGAGDAQAAGQLARRERVEPRAGRGRLSRHRDHRPCGVDVIAPSCHRRPGSAPADSGAGQAAVRLSPRMGGELAIADQIKSDVTTALKAGDRDRVGALRLVLSELQKAAKDGDADEQAVLRRERKRRRESEAAYRDAGRTDLADAEAYEAGVIEAYLPAELDEAELEALVARAIEQTGASGPRDMGKAIKHVMAAAGGRADGRKVSTKVKDALR